MEACLTVVHYFLYLLGVKRRLSFMTLSSEGL